MQAKPLPSSSFHPAWASLLGAGVVLLLVVIALLPATPVLYHTPDTDTSIFLFIGNKIRLGDLPFRDWYDHKPPLIFYLNALGLWLGQGSRWGVWAVELVSLSAAGLFGFSFLKRYYGVLTATLAMSAMLINLVFVHQRGNLTEEYALPFQFAAIFLAAGMENDRTHGWRFFAIGAALAMASSLKQPLAGTGVAIVLFLLVQYAGQERWSDLLRSYLLIGAGFIAIWAVWFVYFAAVGIFPEFWEAAFSYNVALSGITLEKRIGALLSALDSLFEMSGFFLAGMLAWLAVIPTLLLQDARPMQALSSRGIGLLVMIAGVLAGLYGALNMPVLVFAGLLLAALGGVIFSGLVKNRIAPWLARRRSSESLAVFTPLMIALIDLPVAVVFSSLSGNNFGHYFMALLPSLTLLIAFLIHSISNLFDPLLGRTFRWAWLVVILIAVFWPGIYETADRIGPRGDRQLEAVIRYVEEHTAPEDYVLQWGIVPQINLLTGRDAPSRYFFPDPLFVNGYSGREQTEELLGDLQENPPVLIVDQGIPRLPLLMPSAGETCAAVKDPQKYIDFSAYWKERVIYDMPDMPEGMDAVYYWVCQNYIPVGPVGELGWQVYRLKGK